MKKIMIFFLVFLSLVVFFTGICSAQYYPYSPYTMRRQVRYPVNPYPPYPVMRVHRVIVIREVIREYTVIKEMPAARSVYRTSNNYPSYRENNGYRESRSRTSSYKAAYRENTGNRTSRSRTNNYESAYRRNAESRPRRDYKEDNAYRIDMIENEIKHMKKTVEAMSQKWDKNQKSLERLNQELRRLRELLGEYKRRQ